MFSLNKDFVINTAAEFDAKYYNSAGAEQTTSADVLANAVRAQIPFIGEFYNDPTVKTRTGEAVVESHAYRATDASLETITLDAATAATITAAAPTIDTLQYFIFDIFTSSNEVQFGRDRMRAGMRKVYQVVSKASETIADEQAGSLLVQLHNAISQESILTDVPYVSRISYDAGAQASTDRVEESAITDLGTVTITLTAKDEHIFTKTLSVEDDNANVDTSIVTVLDPAIAKRTEGRGTTKFIREQIRILTDVSVRPYGEGQHELAQEGAKYTEISFIYQGARPAQNLGFPGVAGGAAQSSRAHFTFYINEALSGADGYIDKLVAFLQGATVGAPATLNIEQQTVAVGNDTVFVEADAYRGAVPTDDLARANFLANTPIP